MTLHTLAVLTIFLPASFVLAADGSFQRTVGLSGIPAVSVATGSGYVHVYPGPDNQVHVTGHVHLKTALFNDSDADARIKQIVNAPPITQAGNTVSIGSQHLNSDLFQNVSIDYDVRMPASSSLKANAGSGSIEVGGIQGQVTAGSGSGSIHVDNIGANARLDTGSGDIEATKVHGAAQVHTGSGRLNLSLDEAGDVKAQAGSGSIHIDGISGGLYATAGSGSIEVSGNPTSEWRVQNGSGSIHLRLAPSSHCTLSADTGSGSVHVDQLIMMQGDLKKHQVSGTINGGGPIVRARSGSGSITIQ